MHPDTVGRSIELRVATVFSVALVSPVRFRLLPPDSCPDCCLAGAGDSVEAAVRDPKKEIQNLRNLAEQSGRDPASFDVTMTLARPDPKSLERNREAGVTRVLLALPTGGADAILPRLDQLAKLIDG